jgi:hypothetical protein
MKNFRRLVGVVLSVSSFAVAGGAYAQTALPAGATNDLGSALFSTSLTGGWAVETGGFLHSSFSTATFTGTLDTYVVRGDTTNPYGAGNLDFIYRVSNSDVSSDPIHRLTINGFSAFSTSVGYLAPPSPAPGGGFVGIDLAPSNANRTLVSGTVGWSFLDPIDIPFPPFVIPEPGSLHPGPAGFSNFTDYMVLYTNNPGGGIQSVIANVIDGSTANPLSLGPLVIPEPETYAMLLAGLGLLGFMAHRRKQQAA